MNDTLRLMRAHRSVRRFQDRAVDDALVDEALDAARHAATSHAIQAYSVLRVRDAATRARLAELCGEQAHVERAPLLLVVCGDQRRHRLAAELHGRPYVGNLETFLLAVVDASLFAQNLALGLESLGLGTCYVGGLRNRLPEVDDLLAVPHGVLPLFGLVAGWPDATGGVRPRLPREAFFHDGSWADESAQRAAIQRHDAEVAAWWAERGRAARTWSGSVATLFARAAREHLHACYRAQGAELR